jgi:hypothetical protein
VLAATAAAAAAAAGEGRRHPPLSMRVVHVSRRHSRGSAPAPPRRHPCRVLGYVEEELLHAELLDYGSEGDMGMGGGGRERAGGPLLQTRRRRGRYERRRCPHPVPAAAATAALPSSLALDIGGRALLVERVGNLLADLAEVGDVASVLEDECGAAPERLVDPHELAHALGAGLVGAGREDGLLLDADGDADEGRGAPADALDVEAVEVDVEDDAGGGKGGGRHDCEEVVKRAASGPPLLPPTQNTLARARSLSPALPYRISSAPLLCALVLVSGARPRC